MYIHPEAKLVYLAHPRTASMATADALLEAGFHKSGPHHSQLHDGPSKFPGGSGWTIITTVRNHWDTCISWFCQQGNKPQQEPFTIRDFEKRLPTDYVHPHSLWWLHLPDATVVWSFDTLQDDLIYTLQGAGLVPPPLLPKNVSKSRAGTKYQDLYTPESRDYIHDRFRDEIERLGYTF